MEINPIALLTLVRSTLMSMGTWANHWSMGKAPLATQKKSLFPSIYQLTIAHLRLMPLEPLPYPCWNLNRLDLGEP